MTQLRKFVLFALLAITCATVLEPTLEGVAETLAMHLCATPQSVVPPALTSTPLPARLVCLPEHTVCVDLIINNPELAGTPTESGFLEEGDYHYEAYCCRWAHHVEKLEAEANKRQ